MANKYGRLVGGKLIDVVEVESPLPAWAADDAAWLAKLFPGVDDFVSVPSSAVSGATDNGDGTYANPTKPKETPVPKNPGNVWFGCIPLIVPEFWGLFFKVCVILASGDKAPAAERVARLLNSSRAAVVAKIIESNDTIDPDDQNADFLGFIEYLTTTNHETDGEPLLTVTWDDDQLPIAQRTPTGGEVKVLFDNWTRTPA